MFNKIKNYNSVSNQVKRFGAKVTKDISGYYIYNGVNFTAKFNIEYCETSSWTVDIYSEDADEIVVRAIRLQWGLREHLPNEKGYTMGIT